MRGYVPDCKVQVPGSLEEALDLLAREPGRWRPLAGGTDLMVPFAAGRLPDTRFLSLQRLEALRAIEPDDEGITLGALATYTQVRSIRYVQRHLPNLVQSALVTGAVAIQNRGTLGGNLVNGSPAADTPPSLLAYAAQVELTSAAAAPAGCRTTPSTPATSSTVMAPDELLTRDPGAPARARVPFLPQGGHPGRPGGVQGLPGRLRPGGGRRSCGSSGSGLGSVAPVPCRARAAEAAILGRPLDALPLEAAREALLATSAPSTTSAPRPTTGAQWRATCWSRPCWNWLRISGRTSEPAIMLQSCLNDGQGIPVHNEGSEASKSHSFPIQPCTKGCPVKPRSARRKLLPGGIGLALVALGRRRPQPLRRPRSSVEKAQGKPPEARSEAAPGTSPRGHARRGRRRGRPAQAPGRPTPESPGQQPRMPASSQGSPPGGPGPGPGRPDRARRRCNIVRTRDGGEIHRGPGGALREVHTPSGAVIHYAPDGMRHVEVARPDGRVFVRQRQRARRLRPASLPGVTTRPFVQRTYVEHGVVFTRVYRPCVYRGVTYNVYMPYHYYRPGLLHLGLPPLGAAGLLPLGLGRAALVRLLPRLLHALPVLRQPGVLADRFHGGRHPGGGLPGPHGQRRGRAPPPARRQRRPDPGCAAGHRRRGAAAGGRRSRPNSRPHGPGLPRAAQRPAAPVQPATSPGSSWSTPASLAYANGQEIFLSEGDVLQLQGAPPPGASYADVLVMASRDPGVPKGSMVSVSLQDLQEMQNHMRASIDQGLGDPAGPAGPGRAAAAAAAEPGHLATPPTPAASSPIPTPPGSCPRWPRTPTQPARTCSARRPRPAQAPAPDPPQPGPRPGHDRGPGAQPSWAAPRQTANLGRQADRGLSQLQGHLHQRHGHRHPVAGPDVPRGTAGAVPVIGRIPSTGR